MLRFLEVMYNEGKCSEEKILGYVPMFLTKEQAEEIIKRKNNKKEL